MKLPDFTIATIKDDVPKALRRFVGIWINREGYEGGGRKAMLIVTDVTSDGAVTGKYVWGSPGKKFWQPDPAGSTAFRGTISQGELEFELGNQTTMNVRLKGQRMVVRPRMRTAKEEKTSLGYFSPVWQLEAD